MSLIKQVEEALTTLGLPVMWQFRPREFPSLTYHFFNELPALHGDGEINNETVSCQVDIWSKGDYTDIKKQVKSAMKDAGFLFSRASDDYEDAIKIYHCVLVFNFYYESEE